MMEHIGEIFAEVLKPAFAPAEKNEGDFELYGLLRCGKCRASKEMWLDDDHTRKVRICCKCEEEEQLKEAERHRKARLKAQADEMLQALAEMGAVSFPRAKFDMNIGGDEKAFSNIRRYVDKFDEIERKNIGLLIYGEAGCGKTFLAECIANALADQGLMVMYTDIRKLVNAMKEEPAFVLKAIKCCDLLILDDFGAERDTSYMQEQVYEIVNARYAARKPLIVTTNLSPAAMGSEKDLAYLRSFQRVLEICTAIKVNGESRRMNISREKTAALQEILGL